ncbi:MAG: hypothetical protein KDA86_12855 [Planctomycetaceae bacterium]|nr:hypothetical protein [Planctomycetaceae bacterium]
MSKKSLPRELLSAYFDDEVSAEERAQVGRAIEQSPAINQVLEDYRQLSLSLRALREDVPSPGLRDAVMAEICSEVVSTASSSEKSASRHSWMIAGGVMTAAAAGLLIMIWPAVPQVNKIADVGMSPAIESAATTDILLADNDEPPASALAMSEPELATNGLVTDGLVADDSPALHEDGSAEEPLVRTASLPVESLLEQVAKDRHVPQPGDVVKYLTEVADETVWITLTVVDVQMAAGDIRVLLSNHGIVSPVEGETIETSASDPNVVILVESDWEKVAEVVAELDSHGYGQPEDATTSLAMQKVQIEQKLLAPVMRQQQATESLAAPDEKAELNRSEPAIAPADEPPAPSQTRSHPLHAHLTARVSDKDVHEFELRGRSIFTQTPEAAESARELAANEEQESDSAEPAQSAEVDRFSEIYASPSTARVVFLIKKSK